MMNIQRWLGSVLAAAAVLAVSVVHAARATPASSPSGIDARALQRIEGHYTLRSGREVGSELLLNADGTFAWMLSYGADDQFARGRWSFAKNVLTLDAAAAPVNLTFRLVDEEEINIRVPARNGEWIAIVGVSGRGPLSGIEVVFEARSGARAVAVSDEYGDAVVQMPRTERWRRAGLRRLGDTAEHQWFEIPPERAIERIASFAPTDPDAVERSAFTRLVLKRKGTTFVSEDGRLIYSR